MASGDNGDNVGGGGRIGEGKEKEINRDSHEPCRF